MQEFWLWPENWQVFELFLQRLRTQWRSGPGGVIGLDYGEVRKCISEVCSPSRRRSAVQRREELFAQFQAVEGGCLDGWRERRQEREEEERSRRSAHQR